MRPIGLGRDILRAVGFIWQANRRLTLSLGGLALLQTLLSTASVLLLKPLVDAIAEAIAAPRPLDYFQSVAWLMAAQVGAILGAGITGTVLRLVQGTHALIFTDQTQARVQEKTVSADLEHYEDPRYHDVLHRAQEEAPYRPMQILQSAVTIMQEGMSAIAMLIVLLSANWVLTLLIIACALPTLGIAIVFSRKGFALHRELTHDERMSGYYHWVLTFDGFAKELRLFDLGRWFGDAFQRYRVDVRRPRIRLMKQRTAFEIVAQIITVAAVFGMSLYLANRVLAGFMGLGTLVMILQALRRTQSSVNGTFRGLSSLYENSLFLSNLLELFELKPRVTNPEHPRPYPRTLTQGIRFESVGFRYPSETRPCLQDITLEIAPGQKVAIVGDNGSGKSTLVKLLCRLYDPTSGRITIDGHDIREYDLADHRSHIAVVFQDFSKYFTSAEQNIAFGRIDKEPSAESIREAARMAGIDETLAGLPHGYETTLGKWFEEGEELSIGEWQRIALARAFYRDAPIIVLDEPTSALDAESERDFFDTFQRLAEDKTAILISHRFSTVRSADIICVLRDGAISELGTHDELVQSGGRYAELYEIQSSAYR